MTQPERSDLRRRCKTLRKVIEALAARVGALETRAADLERQHAIVQAARASWKPQLVARDKLVLVSDAGDVVVVPLSLVRALQGGRPLDLDVEERGDDVALVDGAGTVVACMPRAAFMALPRVVATQELRRLLELEVGVGVGPVVGAKATEGREVPQNGRHKGQGTVSWKVARRPRSLQEALAARKAARK